jgi:fibronectin-binding autotransporter adhesin
MNLRKLSPILCFSALVSPLLAVDYHFNVADGDWYTPGNWSPGGPPQGGGGNFAYIDAGKTVSIAQDTDGGGSGFDIQDTFVGRGAGNIGTVNQTAGVFNANNGWLFVGDNGGTGTWNVNGSSSLSTGRFYIGGTRDNGGAGNGTLNINTTGTVTLTSDFSVGTVGATGSVVMTAGTLNANTWAIIGETQSNRGGSTGSMIQNGGTVNFGATDAGGRFWIASSESGGTGSNGAYTLNAGIMTSRNIVVGRGGNGGAYNGTFTQNGGDFTVLGGNDDSRIGDAVGATGIWTMTGGTATINTHFQVGGSGVGTFNQSGGSIVQNQWPVIGRFSGSTGTANISGGTFSQANAGARLLVGEEGTGTANISGTADVISAGGVSIGHLGATANGTLNLNGGTLTTPFIGQGSGTAKVNLNGGVLKASANQAEFFNMQDTANGFAPTSTPMAASSIEIKSGGAKINTNGFDIATAVALNGVGSLTKQGNGKLTLNGITTHTGGTFVAAGTLALSATGRLGGAGQIDVATGATLDASASGLSLLAGQTLTGKGTVTGSVLIGSGTLAPGNSIGTENFSGDLTLGATSISNFEIIKLALPDADLANVTGTVTYGGTLNVTSLGGAFTFGDTFNLFDAATIAGSFATVNLPAVSGDSYWVNNLGSNGTITFIPEPGSLLLSVFGLGLLVRRRRA